ncbi:MAG: hypothetical protein KDK70_36795, partial [Myxococcales bacterium]|nr:hypothetical protein [Myxococcales bacterium]
MDYTMIMAMRRRVSCLVVLTVGLGCSPAPTPGGDTESSTGTSSTTSPTTGPTTGPTTSPTTSPTTTNSTADTTAGSSGTTEGPPGTSTGLEGSTSSDGSTGESSGTTEGSSTGSTSDASTDTGSTGGNALPDISGEFLMAVSTVIDPSLPLQYIATFDFTPAGMGGTVNVELQPLALDQGSTTVPRTAFGAPMSYLGLPVAPDG